MQEEITNKLRHSAISFLARREHSEKELLLKLQKKYSATESQILEVLASLKIEGLLSEQRFAESYVRSRVAKGFGKVRINLELRERGISGELAEQAFESIENDWPSLAHKAWQKKYGRVPQSFSERVKQANFLSYRGFRQEDIEEHFSRLLADD